MSPTLRSAACCLAATAFLAFSMGLPGQEAAPAPTAEQVTFFETKVRPVLADNCFSCHGKDLQMAGLRLDSLASMKKGGDSGPAVQPGDPEKSLLVLAIRQTGKLQMPKGKKLAANVIADIENWVRMGTPWPAGPVTAQPTKTLWSLQSVKKPAPPKVKNAAWVANPIDAFVLAGLEAKGLKPAPAADKRTLLRRVTYDLTGLPPSAEEVDAFLADKSPTAYEKAVDRLLASPRYGERWARLWLDVARYADTKGYVFEEDRNYYNAYTYRDWVINAFNSDLPYDQFITQQLAADRLPNVEEDRQALAALGFLNIGRRFLNQQPDIIDDRIDVTMRGFQAFTVACARCHDHKFDPIPTQDYYSLYAIFASSDEATVPISERAIREPWEQHNQKVSASENEVRNLVFALIKKLREKSKAPDGVKPPVRDVLQGLREEQFPNGDQLGKLMPAFEESERNRLIREQKSVEELRKSTPPVPEFAMAMRDRANPSDGYIFRRGNPGSNGGPAPRRFLAALAKPGVEREHWTKSSGRLELAQAIASRENPLTARVMVNRVWMHHFGAGLVRTPSDFGFQGEKPTHPELLDYLATRFMDDGWSVKKLHRLIVTSATYRQSSSVSQAAFDKDPDNRTLNRVNRRRLDLEQMRDSVMLAAGHLDVAKVGGKSVDIWARPFVARRAVYGFVERQNLPGIFRTFDFASPDSTNPRRFMTTVPQQALFFMNSDLVVDQAKALAERPEVTNATDDGQRVRRIYRLLFGRLPDAEETAAGVAFLNAEPPKPPAPLWQYGYGAIDPFNKHVSFTPMTTFTEGMYRVGKVLPDPALGYLLLTGQGGHPGNDESHAVIRRWTAPVATTVRIEGALSHGEKRGDGVRARIVSSRSGPLGEWKAHGSKTDTRVEVVTVEKGETLDFLVDPLTGPAYDGFEWRIQIRSVDEKQTWDATTQFSSPPNAPLSRRTLYAQALMMTNEFLFVD